jgi:hypothetical protein
MTGTILSESVTLTLESVRELLNAQVFNGGDLSVRVRDVGAADLMSDVLALSKPGMLLLTGLVSTQVMRTAFVVDLSAVVFVRGKKPGEAVLAVARETGVPVLGTSMTMFEAAGVLYGALSGR